MSGWRCWRVSFTPVTKSSSNSSSRLASGLLSAKPKNIWVLNTRQRSDTAAVIGQDLARKFCRKLLFRSGQPSSLSPNMLAHMVARLATRTISCSSGELIPSSWSGNNSGKSSENIFRRASKKAFSSRYSFQIGDSDSALSVAMVSSRVCSDRALRMSTATRPRVGRIWAWRV